MQTPSARVSTDTLSPSAALLLAIIAADDAAAATLERLTPTLAATRRRSRTPVA